MICYGVSLNSLEHGLSSPLQQTKKATATNECTSIAGHFDGHVDTLKHYMRHSPMKQIQSHTRCPWMPPLVDYSISIAPAATRVTGKQTLMKKYTYFSGHFDGHGDSPVRYRAHHLIKEVQGFTRCYWTLPGGKYYS
jgi:hypothetical protein